MYKPRCHLWRLLDDKLLELGASPLSHYNMKLLINGKKETVGILSFLKCMVISYLAFIGMVFVAVIIFSLVFGLIF